MKILLKLLTLILVLSFLAVSAHADENWQEPAFEQEWTTDVDEFGAIWRCDKRWQRVSGTFEGGEYVQGTLYYRRCVDVGAERQKVKPLSFIGSYNMPGGSMSCNAVTRKYDGVRFNLYFWHPYSGTNYNPGPFEVPCDPSTINGRIQEYPSTAPWFWFGPGSGSDRQPRWKVNITLMQNLDQDEEMSRGKRFEEDAHG